MASSEVPVELRGDQPFNAESEGSKDATGKLPYGGSLEREVIKRYADGAREPEPESCCPTTYYESEYLAKLPEEIVARDYGCGDPSPHAKEGETVLDLGSGSGKICYILAQKVGPDGQVIGVDFNDAMLALARKYEAEMERRIGFRNFRFHKAKIQDLALDLEKAQARLELHPVSSVEEVADFETFCQHLREHDPLIPDASIDLVVSNCVLNLVKSEDKGRLFNEIARVLKPGGRAVISDIVSDQDPAPEIRNDPQLWSGCIAGAFREDAFLQAFENAGFYGIEILNRQDEPWRVIDGIEFRSITLRAFKAPGGPCLERHQAVVYRGPWREVHDDDGHVYYRGQRMAVCDKTFQVLTDPAGPYAQHIIPIQPLNEVPIESAKPFDCDGPALRHPRQTKGEDYKLTTLETKNGGCSTSGCCD